MRLFGGLMEGVHLGVVVVEMVVEEVEMVVVV